MSLNNLVTGQGTPNDIYVHIEIPANHAPVKYEVDHDTHALFVDRFLSTPMFYPANYGYIPKTLGDDGDPLDALVVTPYPVAPNAVIRCRPVGVLRMSDEAGGDDKLICVPHTKLTRMYDDVQSYEQLPSLLISQIEHFFERYKDLEHGKWVKIESWDGPDKAHELIERAIESYKG
jgi:inorganic pyrophosphatase